MVDSFSIKADDGVSLIHFSLVNRYLIFSLKVRKKSEKKSFMFKEIK